MKVFTKLNRLSCHHVAVSTAQQGRHTGKTARKQSSSPLIARIPCLEVPCFAQNSHSTQTKHACSMISSSYRESLQVSLRPAPLHLSIHSCKDGFYFFYAMRSREPKASPKRIAKKNASQMAGGSIFLVNLRPSSGPSDTESTCFTAD